MQQIDFATSVMGKLRQNIITWYFLWVRAALPHPSQGLAYLELQRSSLLSPTVFDHFRALVIGDIPMVKCGTFNAPSNEAPWDFFIEANMGKYLFTFYVTSEGRNYWHQLSYMGCSWEGLRNLCSSVQSLRPLLEKYSFLWVTLK